MSAGDAAKRRDLEQRVAHLEKIILNRSGVEFPGVGQKKRIIIYDDDGLTVYAKFTLSDGVMELIPEDEW